MQLAFRLLLARLEGLHFPAGANDFRHAGGFTLRALRGLRIGFGARA